MVGRYYLAIDAGEFLGAFLIYDGPTVEAVERYRDALMKPHGYPVGSWGPGVTIVPWTCWYAWFPDALRRYEAAKLLGE